MKKILIALVVALLGGASFYLLNKNPSSPPATHDAKAEAGHGHGDEGLKVTRYGDRTQIFVEFPRLVVGEEAAFAAHLTRLPDFKAIDKGKVVLTLLDEDGKPLQSADVDGPTVPGIFRPLIKPDLTGMRRLVLQLNAGDLTATHDLGKVTVYPSKDAAARAAMAEHVEDHGAISYTKEQQWKTDFGTVEVGKRDIRAAVPATGVLRAEPDGEATLVAPGPGVVTAAGVFPRVGQAVTTGQVLAYLAPRLGGDTDLATLEAAARKAKVAFDQAKRERERMEALFAQEAVAEKRVHAARADELSTRAELDAAERRLGQHQGQGGGVALRAPLAGTLADVRVGQGAFVNEGQLLFHIADRRRLWLEARVAENDIGRIARPQGAWFSVGGIDGGFNVDEGKNGKLIAVGGAIDPATRTVPVVYEISGPDPRLRIGMTARVFIYADVARAALAVPASALIDDNGQMVVYVETGGESYERRPVAIGARDGDQVEIKDGLQVGERIVARGAYQVRLAALSPAAVGHGHVH